MSDQVILTCVKIKSKLRVRIITDGYLNSANVQFPRDLRVEGRKFLVHKNDIKLISTRGKYFYSVKSKNDIRIIDDEEERKILEETKIDLSKITIYENEQESECIICLANNKDTVIIPCGHYYSCSECCNRIHDCPICRTKITGRIHKNQMD